MRLLRDLRETTTVLILLAVTSERHTRLRTLAEELGMTIQGASGYVRRMAQDGLLQIVDGEYRATKRGVELLHSRYLELKGFVDQAGHAMALVETTAAIAGGTIHRGERVGLFMEGGFLMAHADRTSPSTGIAVHDANKGEDVAVRNLEGIVDLHPGRIVIGRVPPARAGGSKSIKSGPAAKIRTHAAHAVVAALDAAGSAAVRRIGLKARIEFGVVPASIEAAERGVDVVLLVPEDRVAEVVRAIEMANTRIEDKISYETVALG